MQSKAIYNKIQKLSWTSCTLGLNSIRQRLGKKNENLTIFVLSFAHLAHFANAKLGGGSERKTKI